MRTETKSAIQFLGLPFALNCKQLLMIDPSVVYITMQLVSCTSKWHRSSWRANSVERCRGRALWASLWQRSVSLSNWGVPRVSLQACRVSSESHSPVMGRSTALLHLMTIVSDRISSARLIDHPPNLYHPLMNTIAAITGSSWWSSSLTWNSQILILKLHLMLGSAMEWSWRLIIRPN